MKQKKIKQACLCLYFLCFYYTPIQSMFGKIVNFVYNLTKRKPNNCIKYLPDELIHIIIDSLFSKQIENAEQIVASVTDALHFAATSKQFRIVLPEIASITKKHIIHLDGIILSDALDIALKSKKLGLISVLLQSGIQFDRNNAQRLGSDLSKDLLKAIKLHHHEKVTSLFSWVNKLPIESNYTKIIIKNMIQRRNERLRTILMRAIKRNNLTSLQVLLTQADKNNLRNNILKRQDMYNYTPLHYIILYTPDEKIHDTIGLLFNNTTIETRRRLLITGCYCHKDMTPLHLALETKKFNAISKLIDESNKDTQLFDECPEIKDNLASKLRTFSRKNKLSLAFNT